jgi:hypothetical protein
MSFRTRQIFLQDVALSLETDLMFDSISESKVETIRDIVSSFVEKL